MYPAAVVLIIHCVISLSSLNEAIPIETSRTIQKRDIVPDGLNEDYSEYHMGIRYDEYPVSKIAPNFLKTFHILNNIALKNPRVFFIGV